MPNKKPIAPAAVTEHLNDSIDSLKETTKALTRLGTFITPVASELTAPLEQLKAIQRTLERIAADHEKASSARPRSLETAFFARG